MIAVDTNILVYAHRAGAGESRRARRALQEACDRPEGWGVAASVVSEFWSVVTHPAAAGGPSTRLQAAGFLDALSESGAMQIWTPGAGFGQRLLQLAVDLELSGLRIFDLQIALTAFENGARELWTHDDDFVKLPGLRIRNPLS